jgi:hypothetical protein
MYDEQNIFGVGQSWVKTQADGTHERITDKKSPRRIAHVVKRDRAWLMQQRERYQMMNEHEMVSVCDRLLAEWAQ